MRKISILSVVVVLLSASCGNRQDSAKLEHDVDLPVEDRFFGNWAALTAEQHENTVGRLLGVDADEKLNANDPLVQRLDFWVNALDSQIRADHPDLLAEVPKPWGMMLVSPNPNAFVGGVPVCFEVPVVLDKGAADKEVNMVFASTRGGRLMAGNEDVPCKKEADPRLLRGLVESFNNSAPACKLVLETENNAPIARVTGECAATTTTGFKSKRLVFLQTANIVHVYSSILNLFKTEEEFVSVLAHELGHYYRSHTSVSSSGYNFFYKVGERNLEHKPKADDTLLPLGIKAIKANEVIKSYSVLQTVAGQKLNSALYPTVGTFAIQILSTLGENAPESCTKVLDMMGNAEFRQKTAFFPYAPVKPDGGAAQYLQFEVQTRACFESIPVEDLVAQGKAWEMLKAFMAEPAWPLELVEQNSVRDFTYSKGTALARIVGGAPKTQLKNALELLDALNTRVTAAAEEAVQVYAKAVDDRVGFYTVEQEADELSAEWLADLGLNPRSAADAHLRLGQYKASRGNDSGTMFPRDLTIKGCEELRAKGWKDSSGKAGFVALGDLMDSHHSSCYRVFNLDREVEAHNLKATQRPAPTPPGGSWEDIQTLARSHEIKLMILNQAKEQGARQMRRQMMEQWLGSDCAFNLN